MRHFALWIGIDWQHPMNTLDAFGRSWKLGVPVDITERESSLISKAQGFVTWNSRDKFRELIRR